MEWLASLGLKVVLALIGLIAVIFLIAIVIGLIPTVLQVAIGALILLAVVWVTGIIIGWLLLLLRVFLPPQMMEPLATVLVVSYCLLVITYPLLRPLLRRVIQGGKR